MILHGSEPRSVAVHADEREEARLVLLGKVGVDDPRERPALLHKVRNGDAFLSPP